MIRIFNTLTSRKEELAIPKDRKLQLFVCGPTVYDFSHIGHARTYISFDAIVKYLRSRDIPIFYLQNITDIDDRIIDRAREEKTNTESLSKKFEKLYYRDMKSLGVTAVDKYARATDHIPQIVKQVKTLVEKGHAYKIEGDGYYFDLSTFPEYGKLSGRTALQAEDSVSRIDEGVNKRNKGDFALWKFVDKKAAEKGEPSWETELGAGRPGWHIEDTAITEHHFGTQYDLHGGAVDLKFPHHEAEIAQQEAASGEKPFVKIWMHTGFLLVNGKKMSKSLKNFVAIGDFLNKHSADELRMLVLSHHYRSPIDYTETSASQAKASWETLQHFIYKLGLIKKSGEQSLNASDALKNSENEFESAMADDFNTPEALAALFRLINRMESGLWDLTAKDARKLRSFIMKKLQVLGFQPAKSPSIPLKIRLFSAARELFRRNKQFARSDALRKKIEALGFIIEDTPEGPLVIKK